VCLLGGVVGLVVGGPSGILAGLLFGLIACIGAVLVISILTTYFDWD
jgi:hypothetical protein